MKEFNYVIKDVLGIHARPAGMLAKRAKEFESKIQITKGEKTILATQLLMLMGLAVKQGEEVRITIEGADEDAAYEALTKFFQENL
ncbi:MAG: HPr family phosphocarrier protein [Lachnospiraceae bacterium]|nr:HPr family phosphocarrier protein [Lachnospiraceae bacterium]